MRLCWAPTHTWRLRGERPGPVSGGTGRGREAEPPVLHGPPSQLHPREPLGGGRSSCKRPPRGACPPEGAKAAGPGGRTAPQCSLSSFSQQAVVELRLASDSLARDSDPARCLVSAEITASPALEVILKSFMLTRRSHRHTHARAHAPAVLHRTAFITTACTSLVGPRCTTESERLGLVLSPVEPSGFSLSFPGGWGDGVCPHLPVSHCLAPPTALWGGVPAGQTIILQPQAFSLLCALGPAD